MPLAAYTTFQDPPPPPYTGPTAMSLNQHKFCFSTVRTLKRLKDAAPFLRPVDPIALNIPHYPIVIKRPMDFSTIEIKLQNSSPNKPPTDLLAPRYRTTDDFVADVRQIFQNCYLFNGPEHFISHQARKLEDILDKQLKQMPPDEEVSRSCFIVDEADRPRSSPCPATSLLPNPKSRRSLLPVASLPRCLPFAATPQTTILLLSPGPSARFIRPRQRISRTRTLRPMESDLERGRIRSNVTMVPPSNFVIV